MKNSSHNKSRKLVFGVNFKQAFNEYQQTVRFVNNHMAL